MAQLVNVYICRHPFKDGKQDLLKAIHYCEMIIERDYDTEEPKETWIEGYRKWKAERNV